MEAIRAPGLRLQILLALAGLMLLAFLPLFFAVASLTRATIHASRERSAHALGEATAEALVATAQGEGLPAARRALARHIGHAGIERACIAELDREDTCAGDALGTRGIEVAAKAQSHRASVRVHVEDETAAGAPLVRIVAFYMVLFALALLVFAYFVLTRLIVRPIDALARATDRVASGSRALVFGNSGAREIDQLGASVAAMSARLTADEEALRAKVAELVETTNRLTQTQAQLVRSERMASVGRLAAGVAHEIGNPITALMGMEDLLLDGDLSIEEERDFLRRMKRETERVHVVLRDLLDFARPEKASLPPPGSAPEPSHVARVADVLSDVLALVRPQKEFKEITLVSEIDESLPQVALSPSRLTQVLLNIVLNAGAALASAKTKDPRLAVRASCEGGVVRISIEDNGPGVAPAVRGSLFEPFVTTKDVGQGTGLGLAVCRGIVESAGGAIDLDATYASGARFSVSLPAALRS